MKLNTNSNSYIIIYSAILVLIVAFLLAFIFRVLKPLQDENVSLDKKKQILAALNIRDLSDSEASAKYASVVIEDQIIDTKGDVQEGSGFVLNSSDYKAGKLALFTCRINNKVKYVIPVYGMGLWGPIWGYVALDADKQTVYGAYFNHESETAGLGAEIKDSKVWQDKFAGKKLYGADGSIALSVKKSSDIKNTASEVDGVTGATLTMNGVSGMLQDGLNSYNAFLKK